MDRDPVDMAKASPVRRPTPDSRLDDQPGGVTPIAVIGLGCRFPGAADPEAFWELLQGGVDAITEVPKSRWDVDRFHDPDPAKPGRMNTRWGGFLDRIDEFDAHFFGISPREAARMDPQQRLLLEVAWEALDDAGQVVDRLAGSATGVFAGIATNDYGALQLSDTDHIDAYAGTGSAVSIAANRISYLFDFRGPSVAVDTACSSSLVAVHLACQSLRSGECTLAIAGGVNVILAPGIAINFSKAGAMAPDGRCKAFDARANGYVRGEGAGIVVLKRLSAALADGDPVRAVLRSSAVNQDGRTNGLMAPNRFSQEALLREAYSRAGVAPGEVQYVEAHGTGTLLGDPIEARALGAVLGAERTTEIPCVIGAVKSNIGHLEAAAGIAGLIKAVLALEHRQIPPNLHFVQPNPHIAFEALRIKVAQKLEPWPAHQGPALAGVSAFGFGGTNSHVVLEEAPRAVPVTAGSVSEDEDRVRVLPLSAHNPEALRDVARRFRDFVAADGPSLRDICYTASVRRSHHDYRLAMVGGTKQEVRDCLDGFLAEESRANMSTGSSTSGRKRKLVFVFSGQGSQWLGMGLELMHQEPVFQANLQRCDEIIREIAGWSLLHMLKAESSMTEIDIIQPALFSLQVALSEMWRSWGIVPNAVVGHSMGEIAAAHFAGGLMLRDALRIVCWRSKLMSRASGLGAMAVIELPQERVERALAEYRNRLSVAASNSPTSTVVSGEPAALDEVTNSLQAEGVFCRRVKVDVAAHSPQIDPCHEEMLQGLEGIPYSTPEIPFFSTVKSGKLDAFDAQYWWRNMRETVQFAQTMTKLLESGHDLFLEISPHPILVMAVSDCMRARDQKGTALCSLRRETDECASLLGNLGALYSAGWPVDWSRQYPEPGSSCIRLPSYPWQKERCWFEAIAASAESRWGRLTPAAEPGQNGHPLLGRKLSLAGSSGEARWESRISWDEIPAFVLDHRVQGVVVLPGAAYIEMALAAARETSGLGPLVLSGVEFRKALFLPDGVRRRVQTVLGPTLSDERSFQIFSRSADAASAEEPWVLHAEGKIGRELGAPAPVQRESPEEIRSRLKEEIRGARFYSEIGALGNNYGPCHQGIQKIWRGRNAALAEIRVPAEAEQDFNQYQLNPALLDAVWQAMGAVLLAASDGEAKSGAAVPIHVDHIKVWDRAGARAWSHVTLQTDGGTVEGVADIDLIDDTGALLVETCGLRVRPLETAEPVPDTDIDRWLYEMKWRTKARSSQTDSASRTARTGTWMILADGGGVAEQLTERLSERGETAVVVYRSDRFERRGESRFGVRADSTEDMEHVLHSVFGQTGGSYREILHLWGLDLPSPERADSDVLEWVEAGCAGAICLTQALERAGAGVAPLWLVTRGAQSVDGTEHPALSQAPLWGLGRVIAQEHPSRWGGMIDLDPMAAAAESVSKLILEIDNPEKEDQIAFRQGQRYVLRLKRKDRGAVRRNHRWRSEASYLITGGLGDLGLEVAAWMVEQGARRLILLSRTGLPPREQWSAVEEGTRLAHQIGAVRQIEKRGATVLVAAVDVADEQQLSSFLNQHRQTGHSPIRGVVHAAGVVQMEAIAELDSARLHATLRPKIAGGWLLHRLLEPEELDFFVLFSSFASLLSSPQLGAYAAANAFLDGLAHYRKSQGLPALAVNWAAWSDVGMAARYLTGGRALARGVDSFTPAQGLAVLGRLINQDSVQVGVMRVEWRTWCKLYPGFSSSMVISELVGEETDAAAGVPKRKAEPIREILLAADPENRQRLLEAYLHRQTARVLGLAGSKLEAQRSLTSLGFDSLMAVELRNVVETDLEVSLPLVQILQGPSVAQLSSRLLEQVLASSLVSAVDETAGSSTQKDDWETLTL